jgi:hypothetical protein
MELASRWESGSAMARWWVPILESATVSERLSALAYRSALQSESVTAMDLATATVSVPESASQLPSE